MKKLGRILMYSLVIVSGLGALGYSIYNRSKPRAGTVFNRLKPVRKSADPNNFGGVRLKLKAGDAKEFVRHNHMNKDICFLVDMRIQPGKKRFFVYDLKKDIVMESGLVTHGSGSENHDGELVFSNTPGSYSTSLGKYKTGSPYNGTFGLAYKLNGLEETNNKAFERFVVLHAHSCVPDDEVYPFPICTSLGCPTVSPYFLQQLHIYLQNSNKPVLLWIYY